MATQLWLDEEPIWRRINKFLPRHLIAFVDRHYSRQTHGSNQILAPGETLLLEGDRSVWGVVHNFDPGQDDTRRWRCTIFRNEGGGRRSSDLIRLATSMTFDYWPRAYGRLPSVPLTSEVDVDKVRHKRDPGRCFRKAGWELWSCWNQHLFIAPGERERLNIQGPAMKRKPVTS